MTHPAPSPSAARTLADLSRVQSRIADLQSEAARLRAELLASSDELPLHPGAMARTDASAHPDR